MGWEVAADGLKPLFSRDIPRLVAGRLGGVARDFLARHGLGLGDIDRFVCHPGGPKVIEAIEEAYGLAQGELRVARAVLRDFGNMSAASVLFVLERLLDGDSGWNRALLTALGPGFTAGFAVLGRLVEVVRAKPYDAVLREQLFTPLGLAHAASDPYEAILHRAAVGHVAEQGAERDDHLYAEGFGEIDNV